LRLLLADWQRSSEEEKAAQSAWLVKQGLFTALFEAITACDRSTEQVNVLKSLLRVACDCVDFDLSLCEALFSNCFCFGVLAERMQIHHIDLQVFAFVARLLTKGRQSMAQQRIAALRIQWLNLHAIMQGKLVSLRKVNARIRGNSTLLLRFAHKFEEEHALQQCVDLLATLLSSI
jgi:hypothetical protein